MMGFIQWWGLSVGLCTVQRKVNQAQLGWPSPSTSNVKGCCAAKGPKVVALCHVGVTTGSVSIWLHLFEHIDSIFASMSLQCSSMPWRNVVTKMQL